jgi:hypothetical protein
MRSNRIAFLTSALLAACAGNSDEGGSPLHGGPDSGPHNTGPDASVNPPPDGGTVTGTCGTCPTGYHCGTANGLQVCRNDTTQIPLFSHVFVIVMENLSYSTLTSNGNASASPFLHGLMTSAAYATDYHGVSHPSLPNYIAMTSGDTYGIGCDCEPSGTSQCSGATCNIVLHSCNCSQQASNLADQVEAAGKTWKAYGEEMGAPCNLTDSGGYAVRHVPFLYYQDVQSSADRCNNHVVDYATFTNDASSGTVPNFTFIAPNLTHDMHDPVFPGGATNITNGDTWLSSVGVPAITSLDAYKNGGLLVIVWDEDDYSGVINKDDAVPMFVMSPYAKTNYPSPTHADHYSLLATFEDGLGLPRITANVQNAAPLSDFFPAQ